MKPTIKDYQRRHVTEKLTSHEIHHSQLLSLLLYIEVTFNKLKSQIRSVEKQMTIERNRLNKLKS